MQITSTAPSTATYLTDRASASPAATGKPQDAAAEQAKKEAEKQAAAKVFTPAPPLRPNIQDYVDINRTLISLRKF